MPQPVAGEGRERVQCLLLSGGDWSSFGSSSTRAGAKKKRKEQGKSDLEIKPAFFGRWRTFCIGKLPLLMLWRSGKSWEVGRSCLSLSWGIETSTVTALLLGGWKNPHISNPLHISDSEDRSPRKLNLKLLPCETTSHTTVYLHGFQ